MKEDTSMTTNELRAAAEELLHLHNRFAPLFGRKEAQLQSFIYLHGLLLAPGRKSAEPMALIFGEPEEDGISQNQVLALQRFLTYSPWEFRDIHREIQAVFAEELVPAAAEWPIGTVGVIDESGFVKQGKHSVGVQRQYCGRVGKKENCQVGVFLVGVTPAGSALLEQQLYLPETWAHDADRRKETAVPDDIAFQTKAQIAVELLQRTRINGLVKFDWVTADEFYGHDGGFLDELEAMQQRYVVEVPVNTTVWTVDPQTQMPSHAGRRGPVATMPPRASAQEYVRSVRDIAQSLPSSAWQVLQLRTGAKGPLAFAFARLRVWAVRHRRPGPACWLLWRRSLEPDGEVKFYISNAPAEEPLETMALVTGTRYRVEEYFEDGKGYLGMAQYEARAWSSWHHHMSLVALAHLFVTLTRIRLKKKTPELTLDMALRLVTSALARPELNEAEAIAIVDYHLRRNRTALKSHAKSWHQQHKKVRYKVLL
jgi:SRSO17 transposase